jgi:DinB superfamily
MNGDRKVLGRVLDRALSGKGAHVGTGDVFAGLTWKAAGSRPRGVPHSAFQLLNHMTYWQDWVVEWLGGHTPRVPKHAAGGWPGPPAPATPGEWQKALGRYRSGLKALERWSRKEDPLAKRGTQTRLEMLQAIASHNSYHVGQVVIMRQMGGTWPPPKGGLTW